MNGRKLYRRKGQNAKRKTEIGYVGTLSIMGLFVSTALRSQFAHQIGQVGFIAFSYLELFTCSVRCSFKLASLCFPANYMFGRM